MKKEELAKLSDKDLIKKERSTKALMIIFIPLILGLSYFGLRDYAENQDEGLPTLIIALCCVGGLLSLIPELKSIRTEKREKKKKLIQG